MVNDLNQEEKALKTKIFEESKKEKEEVKESIPSKAKPDLSYLNLKKAFENLIKQKQYEKAVEIEKKLKKVEKLNQQKWDDQKNERIKIQIERLEKVRKRNLSNFLKKKELALFEFERNKIKEYEKLIKRYKNTVSDVVLSQKTLKTRLVSSNINKNEPKLVISEKIQDDQTKTSEFLIETIEESVKSE